MAITQQQYSGKSKRPLADTVSAYSGHLSSHSTFVVDSESSVDLFFDFDKYLDQEAVLSNVRSSGPSASKTIVCSHPGCEGGSFGRITELTRHEKTFHNDSGGKIPCPASGCPRGLARPYPAARKDKLKEHVQRMHKSPAERDMWPLWFDHIDRAAPDLTQGT